ncbi:MAG: hypothetical protein DSO07_01300 [Thermoproteota archaeon]|nr:MAG: hypothetical protein DSO07_01300 [Candidatus Korarchaeota archaeon]
MDISVLFEDRTMIEGIIRTKTRKRVTITLFNPLIRGQHTKGGNFINFFYLIAESVIIRNIRKT